MLKPTFSVCMDSPIGELTLLGTATEIHALRYDKQPPVKNTHRKSTKLLDEARKQLDEYFQGHRHSFHLPLKSFPPTFSARAQIALADIPYAQTWTYAQLASAAGSKGAVRAAGSACARNPLPLLLPCHRVIRSDGEIGSYQKGSAAKRWLLDFEKSTLRNL